MGNVSIPHAKCKSNKTHARHGFGLSALSESRRRLDSDPHIDPFRGSFCVKSFRWMKFIFFRLFWTHNQIGTQLFYAIRVVTHIGIVSIAFRNGN